MSGSPRETSATIAKWQNETFGTATTTRDLAAPEPVARDSRSRGLGRDRGSMVAAGAAWQTYRVSWAGEW